VRLRQTTRIDHHSGRIEGNGGLFDHQPYSETAIRSMANTTVDVAALEANIDVTHLPRQAEPPEVYQ
jgi:hypothetical protein